VEKLTDLEINKAIAIIEGQYFTQINDEIFIDFSFAGVHVITNERHYKGADYNPVKDGSLSMDLMIKYDVIRQYEPYDCLGWYYTVLGTKSKLRFLENDIDSHGTEEAMPRRAICLAIMDHCKPINQPG